MINKCGLGLCVSWQLIYTIIYNDQNDCNFKPKVFAYILLGIETFFKGIINSWFFQKAFTVTIQIKCSLRVRLNNTIMKVSGFSCFTVLFYKVVLPLGSNIRNKT